MLRSLPSARLLALLLLLGGCAASPVSQYYTLPLPALPRGENAQGGLVVAINTVTLPDLVDRPQWVLRQDDQRVMLSETLRWAEPLRQEVGQVLAANLARELGSLQVAAPGQRLGREPEVRLGVDFLRFDTYPGRGVRLEARWTLQRGEGPAQVGYSEAREAVAGLEGEGGQSDEAARQLTAAHGRALASISREIAAALRTSPSDSGRRWR